MTVANGKGPPGEQPSKDFHGNGALWTVLLPGGLDTTGTSQPDGSISEKFPWWTVGTTGGLAIHGRRLDAAADPMRAGVTQSFLQLPSPPSRRDASGQVRSFSTAGCWEITGQVGDSTLRFVIFVAKPD
jgi:hypothetical protein